MVFSTKALREVSSELEVKLILSNASVSKISFRRTVVKKKLEVRNILLEN